MRTAARRALEAAFVIMALLAPSALRAEPPDATNANASASEAAREILRRSGERRGVCAVLGAGDLALELARASELLVHLREPDGAAALERRRQADLAGFPIERLTVEEGGLERLPYADSSVDLVVALGAGGDPPATPRAEMLRVLRPEGLAVIAFADPVREWSVVRKPPLEGADDWSHWERGPDNNPVSKDRVIKAPYMTQFLAGPYYIGMPSVTTAAGGRTFLAVGHIAHHRREWETLYTLSGRNGYNGTVLWERKLPEGYLVHGSSFIATKDTFYMLEGERCLLLDPATGTEKEEIRIPGLEGEWKWMALQDGVLLVLAGKPGPGTEITKGDRSFGGWSWADLSKGYYAKRIPYGFGDTLAAWDLAGKSRRWLHKEETLIDARGMAADAERLYLYAPDRHLRALDIKKGEVVWTNGDSELRELIEAPGRGLTSTPGFRTQCLTVATPEALIIQGQTHMNVVGVSTKNGYLLWTKQKVTNNPNAIYVDGKVILGVGPGGSHVAMDPLSGQVEEDLGFHKVACTRLTATTDSFFCRGEGTLRFDRATKKLLVDGAARPACNDGALAANGMLYLGPWQCDCNLSLIGHLGKCSAGDFRFDHPASTEERLYAAPGGAEPVAALPISDADWPTYRGDNRRTASSPVALPDSMRLLWQRDPPRPHVPAPPAAAGGLVFIAGADGKVRALDGASGAPRWEFATPAPIKAAPTVWEGRVYAGSGDGHVYALEATSGRLLWRFRAAPLERHILVYGFLSSTWPVNTGVLVEDGVAYFAAGIIDSDGTYVYALDAKTGKLKWQNVSSGHLSPELRKGVSAQGNLTIRGKLVLLAGGNQVSPAAFDIETGECLAGGFDQGRPKANGGSFVGVFRDDAVIAGGRVLYSAPENVATKASFDVVTAERTLKLAQGGIPPAWDGATMALVNFKHGKLTACDAEKAAARIRQGYPERSAADRRGWLDTLAGAFAEDGAVRWQADLGEAEGFEALSLAVAPEVVVAVIRHQDKFRAQGEWFLAGFDAQTGKVRFRTELPREPVPGGLLIDRQGRVVVAALDGSILAYGKRAEES
jgi:outer membrane protein assembly factor BamB/SAM-dependent methyltransferase